MKYINIENALIKPKPIFSSKDIEMAGFKVFPYQLSKWVKDGHLKRLIGGLFLFNRAEVNKEFIANHLRQPSYISLEYALYYYNLTVDIPFHVTSVTSKGTKKINIENNTFFYQHLKSSVFTGFVAINEKEKIGKMFYIATPEKAFVDLFYLNPNKLQSEADFKEARFHENEIKKNLNWKDIFCLSDLYNNKRLKKRLSDFKDYLAIY